MFYFVNNSDGSINIYFFLFEFMIIIISLTNFKTEKKFQCDIIFIIHFIKWYYILLYICEI